MRGRSDAAARARDYITTKSYSLSSKERSQSFSTPFTVFQHTPGGTHERATRPTDNNRHPRGPESHKQALARQPMSRCRDLLPMYRNLQPSTSRNRALPHPSMCRSPHVSICRSPLLSLRRDAFP